MDKLWVIATAVILAIAVVLVASCTSNGVTPR
jgi:hypothetical protein